MADHLWLKFPGSLVQSVGKLSLITGYLYDCEEKVRDGCAYHKGWKGTRRLPVVVSS